MSLRGGVAVVPYITVCAGDRARRAVADHDQAPRPFLDAYVVCHVVEHLTPVMLGGGGGDTPARCAFLGLGATNLTETFTARVVGSIVSIVDAFAGIWDDVAMGDCEVAQAVELVRALRQQLHEMTYRLTWLESHQDVTGTNGQASAIRCEAAALRLDISEAQFFIDRLQRRYLSGDEERPVTAKRLA
jgi:hypothetical protein